MKMYGKAQETASSILEAFRNPETLPAALAPIFIHRKDDLPCRKWSWRNQFLTALAGTSDARGYRQWQAVDRQVKKGAKAFGILSPCVKKIKDKDTGEDTTACYGFKATSVFRLEDTEGADLPVGDPEIEEWLETLPLFDVARSWDIDVSAFNGEGARYLGAYQPAPLNGRRKSIALGVKNVRVFLHELCHAADHRNGHDLKPGQHFRQEVVAEFGSAVLLECLGLDQDADLGNAYKYIERYSKAAGKTPQAASLEVLDRICKAVALVLDVAESLTVEMAVAS